MFDRFEMFSAMITRKPLLMGAHRVLVNRIECEDGSGRSFIVTGQAVGYSVNVSYYVRFRNGGNTEKVWEIMKVA